MKEIAFKLRPIMPRVPDKNGEEAENLHKIISRENTF